MSAPPSGNDQGDLRHAPPGKSSAMEHVFGAGSGVATETPTMRSIALSAGPSPLVGPPPAFGAGKFSGGTLPLKSFAGLSKPPKLGGIPRPASFGKKPVHSAFHVKQEWSGASTPSTWDVKGEDLEMVPWEFPLERTHREIEEDATCVSKRISDCLRKLSVEAEFSSEKAKAKCKTADYVCFRIRLFAGGENGQPVVVEMQRRSGSASSFMRTCRALLDAAEGVSTALLKSTPPPFANRPISSMKCLAGVVPKQQDFQADAVSALDRVQDMLRSEQKDSNVLGLENLCALTDPLKTNATVAMHASKLLILGSDDKTDLREEIRLLTERDVFSQNFEKEQVGPSGHADHMCFLALCVLANSLSMCSQDGSLAAALKEQRWFVDSLFTSLVEELKRASMSMNSACKAASCLHSMMSCSPDVSRTLTNGGFMPVLEGAHKVGKNRHELLANETQRCLEVLGL